MNTVKNEEILELLKSLKDEARQRYKAELKGVFGSYARGEENEDSDVDVLVDFLDNATLFELVGLGDFLEEKLNCKIDIVSQRAVREEIRPYIYRDLVYL
ncbi:nucleotidyltransferase family protein [Candidatus Poribacteria bacterium]|nr:nucleotidyltransferase family protein [Candidatus Poribacteria bacterium]